MPPISVGELMAALIGASITRAICVGFTVWLAMLIWPDVHVAPIHGWAILWFGLLGSAFLGFLGLLTSIWAEKFDHAAAVTNFVIAPLRSEAHTSELQSLMRISYAVFCLKKKSNNY